MGVESWEITHYCIVLVFVGKALLKRSVQPSHNSFILFSSLHHTLDYRLHLNHSVSSFSSLCHALLHHNPSLQFLSILSVWQCFSQALFGKGAGTGSSLAPDNGTHQKAAPTSPASHTHAHTEQDKQDIPAAGCTGFLALANLKRRVRLGVEWSRTAREGESRGEEGSQTEVEEETDTGIKKG